MAEGSTGVNMTQGHRDAQKVGIPGIVLAMMLVLPGCVVEATKQAPVLVAREIPQGKESKPVAFRKIVLKIPRTKAIGKVGGGIFCVEIAKRRARSGR